MAPPVLTSNSPTTGYIAWTAFSMSYLGKTFSFAAGNTNHKYTYWQYNNGNGTPLQFTDDATVVAALTDDDCLLFLNKTGTAVNAVTATMLDGDLIVPGSILADQIAVNTLTAKQIAINGVNVSNIAANVTSGGGYINVIPDPAFSNANRRAAFLQGQPAGWSFEYIPQLLDKNVAYAGAYSKSTAGFTAGPKFTIAMDASVTDRMNINGNGTAANPGDVIISTTNKFPVTAGKTYTAKTTCTLNSGVASASFSAQISWYNASNTLLSTSTGTATDGYSAGYTYYVQAAAPSGATQASVALIYQGPTSTGSLGLYLWSSQYDADHGLCWWLWPDVMNLVPDSYVLEYDLSQGTYDAGDASHLAGYGSEITLVPGITIPRGSQWFLEMLTHNSNTDPDSFWGLGFRVYNPDGTVLEPSWYQTQIPRLTATNAASSYTHDFNVIGNNYADHTVDLCLFARHNTSVGAGIVRFVLPGAGQVGFQDPATKAKTIVSPNLISSFAPNPDITKAYNTDPSLILYSGLRDSSFPWSYNTMRGNLGVNGLPSGKQTPDGSGNTADTQNAVNLFTNQYLVSGTVKAGYDWTGVEILPQEPLPYIATISGNKSDRFVISAGRSGALGSTTNGLISLLGSTSSDLLISSTGTISFNTPVGLAGENWHIVGTSGQPAFQGGWHNNTTTDAQIGFYKDANGFVHLQGVATGGTLNATTPVFTLPAGYRPSATINLPTTCNGGVAGQCRIDSSGNVFLPFGSTGWNSLFVTPFAGS